MPPANISEEAIRAWCIAYVERTIGDAVVAVGPDVSFARMGLDSASSAYFIVELEEWLGTELDPEIVSLHPTIAALARHIAARLAGGGG